MPVKFCFVPLGHSTWMVFTLVSPPNPKVRARSLCDAYDEPLRTVFHCLPDALSIRTTAPIPSRFDFVPTVLMHTQWLRFPPSLRSRRAGPLLVENRTSRSPS